MRLSLFSAVAAAALSLTVAGAAQAATSLIDDFNSDTPSLNWTGDAFFTSTSPIGNAPHKASVDLIGSGAGGTSYNLLPGNGYYVDLDGTSGNGNSPVAGQLTSTDTFAAGHYTLSFDLAGNHRTPVQQTTVVTLGGVTLFTITPTSYLQGFTHYSTTFTTAGGTLVFTDFGPSDYRGNLLDNVSLIDPPSAAPEPMTWALMLLGFVGLGGMLRSRNTVRAVAA